MNNLYIDADTILYKAAFASEVECDWGNDQWTLHSDLKDAKGIFEAELEKINEVFTWLDGERVLCFSHTQNFRKDLLWNYKANRKKQRKPVVLRPLKEWAIQNYNSLVVPSLEADDLLGLHSRDSIMVSIDKDLKTVPGQHYNPNDIITGVYEITPDQAHYHHMMQTLCGDSTDVYQGCPFVGPKKAEKILDVPTEDMWSAVLDAYKKLGLTYEDTLIQARVARILRGDEYNWESCKIHLWSPEGGET